MSKFGKVKFSFLFACSKEKLAFVKVLSTIENNSKVSFGFCCSFAVKGCIVLQFGKMIIMVKLLV